MNARVQRWGTWILSILFFVGIAVTWYASAPVLMSGLTPPVRCGYCDHWFDAPSMWRWDGAWVWPQDQLHALRSHAVRLPDALVRSIRSRAYRPPARNELDEAKGWALFEEMARHLRSQSRAREHRGDLNSL